MLKIQSELYGNIKRKNCGSFVTQLESKWSGSIEDAFFSSEMFDRQRVLNQPEYEASGRSNKSAYYVLSADVGRKNDTTAVCVFKVTPQPQGPSIKSLVNIYTLEDRHFEEQAIKLKKLFYKYKARRLVLDANGIGMGLVDFMVKPQVDPETSEVIPDFGVFGGTQENDVLEYKKFRTQNTEHDALFLVKANAAFNTEAHTIVRSNLSSGKLKFLIDERVAKQKLLNTKVGKNMKPEERAKYLAPFTLTSILKEELLNLREETEGVNIILKRANRGIKKDKFSALEYGLYYIKIEEESKRKKKKFNAKEWMLMN